jgi:hypothetical protein
MRYDNRTRSWGYVLVVGLQSVVLWVAPPAWAGVESYDPRLDPNYTRAMSTNPSLDWRAIEALGREFQARSALIGSQPVAANHYAQPQPWHYAGADYPMMVSQAGYPSLDYWTSPVGGQYPYWYGSGSGVYGWRAPSPRIPWWSLVPSRHHYRSSAHLQFHGRHGGVVGHRSW